MPRLNTCSCIVGMGMHATSSWGWKCSQLAASWGWECPQLADSWGWECSQLASSWRWECSQLLREDGMFWNDSQNVWDCVGSA